MPGDWHSQAWASPFAVRTYRAFFRFRSSHFTSIVQGASWSPNPLGATDERVRRWEQITL
ncbi:hypothetical protein BDR07DRAFT_1412631 [Suillus spraguei]|nr:hypothetical protein BDR07DRAFT_1412631 [Suillus spraguei]